ncbi:MAG: SRPBCC domain-containing protein [Hyphomicrobiales bacterium]|uniref:SRPBCC family protein n=1 Tax=Aestuariivirga sp. TaxID=2650926 RepID=UPI0035B377E5
MLSPVPLSLDIHQEADFGVPPDTVFNALTRDVQNWWVMRQTTPDSTLSLLPRVGSSLTERSPDGHEVIWGTLEEVRRPDRLYFSGRFAVRGAVAGRVHFDLERTGHGGCRLILVHQAVGNISSDTRAGFDAGWNRLIGQCLASYLLRAA